MVEGIYSVTAMATDKTGRTDESIGAVPIDGMKGETRANAMMKAETKAKRRVTLSICGLGMLDETEVETIPGAFPTSPPPVQQTKPAPAALPAGGQQQSPPSASAVYVMLSKNIAAAQTPEDLEACKKLMGENKAKLLKGEGTMLMDELKIADEEIAAAEAERKSVFAD